MATSNTALRVTELDFDGIKNNLKNYLRNQTEFQDFDFDGSGMSVLLDVLAYNTHYMGYYLNMVANENFIDTAQIRSSVISHAKTLGYTPISKKGAVAKVNLLITPSNVEDQNTNIVTLDRYTKFIGADIDGVNYPFIAINANTTNKMNGSFSFANVYIKQGEVVTKQFLMDSTNISRRFKIPSANVDTSTISVRVQESSSNSHTTEYTLATDIMEVRSNSTVYFVEEDMDSDYTIYFGDDYIGKKPKNGNIIICTYVDTVGSQANSISSFAAKDPIGGLFSDNVRITTANSSFGGTDKESIEDVRFRAPRNYTVQNRAVISSDYEILLTKDFPNIESVSVWGGEDNDPVVYGKVFISAKPKGNFYISELDKERIKNSLIGTRNVLTVMPEIVDPDYVFLLLKIKINYDSKLTSLTAGAIETLVRQAISDYINRELNGFNSVFRKSKLQYYIENCEPSITGSDVQVYAQKRKSIVVDQVNNQVYKFSMPLKKGDYIDNLYSFPQVTVKDIENFDRNVYFEEVPNSFTGIDSITIINPGKNYLSPPTVTISGDGTGATAKAVIVNGRVNRIEITNRGVNYTRATITITGGDGSEATAIAKLEARIGALRTYYYKANGEKVVVNKNAGIVDYESGQITITNLNTSEVVMNDYYPDGVLTIAAPVGRENLYPSRNRIVTIDENDSRSISIEIVAES
jgi:hypothetical protein